MSAVVLLSSIGTKADRCGTGVGAVFGIGTEFAMNKYPRPNLPLTRAEEPHGPNGKTAPAPPPADPAASSGAPPRPARAATVAKPESSTKFRLKIVGVGGAGGNMIGRIAAARESDPTWAGIDLLAVNTDRAAVESVAGAEHIQIGAAVTHGLSAGGDHELGLRAAQQDAERLGSILQNVDVVFLCAGLGGGTGGGAGPVLARIARERGALVLALVVMPFQFEGDRRRQQALAGLEQLKAQADAVICFPNDKLVKLANVNANVLEAFQRCDETVVLAAQAIWQLFSRKGLINVDFADLRGVLGAKHGEAIFGHGQAQGADKAAAAVKLLLESPLMDGGDVLARADGVLISILGGPDLTLADVQKTVEPISRQARNARITMGAAIDPAWQNQLAVTVIAATAPDHAGLRKSHLLVDSKPVFAPQRMATSVRPSAAMPAPTTVAPAAAVPAPAKKEPAKPKQENLPLERVSRGPFEKTEPTLYDGEDLDVPTYIRHGVSLKR